MTAPETKQKIVDAAASIIKKKGWYNFSMRSVAKEVGITQSVLYYHFKNKQEIMAHLIKQILDHLETVIAKHTKGKRGKKRIEEMIFVSLKYGRQMALALQGNVNKHGIKVDQATLQQSMPIRERLMPQFYDMYAQTLREEIKKKTIRKVNIDEVCEIITYTLKGYGVIHILDTLTDTDYRTFAKQFTNMLYHGIS